MSRDLAVLQAVSEAIGSMVELKSVRFAGQTSGHSAYYSDRGRGIAEANPAEPSDAALGFWIEVEMDGGR